MGIDKVPGSLLPSLSGVEAELFNIAPRLHGVHRMRFNGPSPLSPATEWHYEPFRRPYKHPYYRNYNVFGRWWGEVQVLGDGSSQIPSLDIVFGNIIVPQDYFYTIESVAARIDGSIGLPSISESSGSLTSDVPPLFVFDTARQTDPFAHFLALSNRGDRIAEFSQVVEVFQNDPPSGPNYPIPQGHFNFDMTYWQRFIGKRLINSPSSLTSIRLRFIYNDSGPLNSGVLLIFIAEGLILLEPTAPHYKHLEAELLG